MIDKAQRRLAAILAADVAGYTRLVELDTDGTVVAWKSARDNVIKPLVDKKSGHIIKFTGDGFLVEFPSVQDAVACAITLQEELRSSSLNFRIGINVGDITDDGGDVHGEGVNIAARLEALAEPGGICISGDVYNQVRNRIDASFKDMGKQEVKHVSQPLSVFAINPTNQKTSDHLTSQDLALPDKPSIAVLPFDNLSGDPQQEYIADGIAEEILTALATIPDLFVIARNSSFIYKGRGLRVDIIGQELGVQYVLEGSVHQSGKRMRITVQLIEAKSGKHLWAERYDRELDDIFALQDEIAREVTITLQIKLGFGEALVTYQGGTRNHDAWQLCLKGIENYHQISRAGNTESRRFLEEAVALDAEYEGAMIMLGWANYSALRWDLIDEADNAACLNRLKEVIGNLLTRNPEHGDGHFLTCALRVLEFDYDSAIEAGVRAVAAKPNDPNAHAYLAGIYAGAGRLADALPRIKYALRLSPHYGTWMLAPLLVISYQSGKHNDAITYARSGVERAPDSIPFYSRLVALLGATGRIEEGKAALARLHELDLNFSVIRFKKIEQHTDSKITEEWCEGLRAVGVPE
jgi:adenylate cyclase